MITAKEARNITDEAKKTGAVKALQELEETLESFEPRIRRVCENGSNSTGFRLKFIEFLSDKQMQSFVKNIFLNVVLMFTFLKKYHDFFHYHGKKGEIKK